MAPRDDDCCAVDPRIARHFDRATEERMVDGALPPMQPISERLYEQLSDVAELRPTVLELGCGSGGLSVALARDGATRVDGIDLSGGSVAAARRRATEAGVAERASFEVGDGARTTHAAHDWVILDRAICCYSDMPALLGAALSAAPARVAFSVPTSRGLRGLANRLFWGLEARFAHLREDWCAGYVHSVDDIERRLTAAGFRRRSTDSTFLWYTAVWDRL